MAQLPGDTEVVRAQLRIERKARLAAPALPSSFAADVAEITGAPVLAYGACSALGLLDPGCAVTSFAADSVESSTTSLCFGKVTQLCLAHPGAAAQWHAA